LSHEPMQHAANVARTCNTHSHTRTHYCAASAKDQTGPTVTCTTCCISARGGTVPHWLGGGMPPHPQLPGQGNRRWANREKVKVAKKCPHGKTGLCNLCPHEFSGQRSICSVLCYRVGEGCLGCTPAGQSHEAFEDNQKSHKKLKPTAASNLH